jgi:hypothetical protein
MLKAGAKSDSRRASGFAFPVIPAKAGIHSCCITPLRCECLAASAMDPGFRRGDDENHDGFYAKRLPSQAEKASGNN